MKKTHYNSMPGASSSSNSLMELSLLESPPPVWLLVELRILLLEDVVGLECLLFEVGVADAEFAATSIEPFELLPDDAAPLLPGLEVVDDDEEEVVAFD